ncbi:MAG: prolipoprotein diacylglyceryl transferase [Clostridiales bacterium]|nr:prolipoprotein diacylglyceryl transferase [Clostridiales bacterium]
MLLLGGIFGTLFSLCRSSKYDIKREDTLYALLFGLSGGLIGAKILFLIVNFKEIWEYRNLLWKNPGLYLNALFGGGLVFYGGLIGGCIFIYLYCKKYKISYLKVLDLLTPSIALAHGFGRIGCFLAGCCYGMPVGGSLGIAFENSPVAPNNIPLFPVQLVESGFNFALCAVLLIYAKKDRSLGKVAGLYLLIYPVVRFLLEFLRSDSARGFISGISTSQIISIFLLPIGFILFRAHKIKRKLK